MKTTEYIEYILKNYWKIKRDIEMLEAEIKIAETDAETIEGLTFHAQVFGGRIQNNAIKNSTARIALVYKQENDKTLRCIDSKTTAERLRNNLQQCVDFIDAALIRLGDTHEQYYFIIKGLYIERIKWKEFYSTYDIPRETLNRFRRKCIELMAEWWEGRIVKYK